MQSNPKLRHSLRAALRLQHFSRRTEEAYVYWVKRFVHYQGLRHPGLLSGAEVVSFLTHLAVERQVAPATQTQAHAALAFLYREVLRQPLDGLGPIPRPRQPTRLPAVLTPAEVRRVLDRLSGTSWLVGALLYEVGSGCWSV